jgi:nucleotide-binding universal stress UspA family protein
MSLKHILADIGGQLSDDPVLELAWEIASPDRAHISVLHVRRDRVLPAPDGLFSGLDRLMSGIDGLMVEDLPEDGYDGELALRENKALVAFRSFLARRKVPEQPMPGRQDAVTASWRIERTSDPAALTHLARVCDLTVMARPTSAEIDLSDDADAILRGTGRPILLTPATQRAFHPYRDMLIAWDGSVAATHAVELALPLLAHADRVRIFTRSGASDAPPESGSAGAMRYLAQHGITAESIGIGYPDLSVAEDLLATCHACEASLLVMGAYGHSRTREAIFGGVSQHVIEHALLPVLMVP